MQNHGCVLCYDLQLWDTRQAACVLTVADNEDFISDMACDAEKKTLLATRYCTHNIACVAGGISMQE